LARTISATVTINAAPAEVWAVLCDLDRYPGWYPDLRRATGKVQVGSRVALTIAPPGRRVVVHQHVVTAAQPGAELRWAGLRSGRSGEHSFTLSPIDSGTRTKVVQSSTVAGYLARLLSLFLAVTRTNWAADLQAEFDRVNQALKRRAEQGPDTAYDYWHPRSPRP
jgi:hypothetical protein